MTDAIIGILGSGQLSRMLIQSSSKAGVTLHVYANAETDPAAREAEIKGSAQITLGNLSGPSDAKTIRDFLSHVPVCGFESELIDCELLRTASSSLAVRFIPDLEIMEKLSEKLEQKRLFSSLGIPSAVFSEMPEADSQSSAPHDGRPNSTIDSWLESLKQRFGNSFVVKWSKYGYDGRGVVVVTDDASLKSARASCKVALARGSRLYAEERVAFTRELAIIGCQSTNGELVTYPLVVSEQEHGICRKVVGPATSLGVNARFETLAVQYAEKIAKALPLHGSFGLEFFETPSGDLWVNEIAPRVHNSGHYTQNASVTDQFTNHLRALSGQMLGNTGLREEAPFFAMLNLLGPRGFQGEARAPEPLSPGVAAQGLFTHWYGKEEAFPGRKLGHLNCVAKNREELTSRIALMENHAREWESALLRRGPKKK